MEKVNRCEESCISKTSLRLLSDSFRTLTLTAGIAVDCWVEQQQLQLQPCLGSLGALLRYGLISREKRNYPESQSVGSVRRIISPWKCGRAVLPSCWLSEQSALRTLGARRVSGTGTELAQVKKQGCPAQVSSDWSEFGKEACCFHASCVVALRLQEHLSFCRMPFLPLRSVRGVNINGVGATCKHSCTAEFSRSSRSVGTRGAAMARGQQGFYGSNVTDIWPACQLILTNGPDLLRSPGFTRQRNERRNDIRTSSARNSLFREQRGAATAFSGINTVLLLFFVLVIFWLSDFA